MTNQTRIFPLVLATDGVTPGALPQPAVLRGVAIADGTEGAAQQVVGMVVPGVGLAPVNVLGLSDSADGVPPAVDSSLVGVVSRMTLYNPTAAAYSRAVGVNAGIELNVFGIGANSAQLVAGVNYLSDGVVGLPPQSAAHQFVLSSTESRGAGLVTCPGEWTATSFSASAGAPSASRAGAAGVSHVCRSITIGLSAVAPQLPVRVVLRDGAAGVGDIRWQALLAASFTGSDRVTLSDLNIVGTAGAAMTLEFVDPVDVGNGSYATLSGFSTPA